MAVEGTWKRSLKKGESAIAPAPAWAAGEPSNTPPEKDCAFSNFGEPWTAGKCTDTRGFVCEYDCKPKNACQVATSDPKTGCRITTAPNGTTCDDLDPCTLDGACSSGVCQKGPPKVCDDKNPCTTDSCRAGVGCESKLNYVLTGYSKNSGYLQCKEPRTWSDAVTACKAQGPDWELFAPEANTELEKAAAKSLLIPEIHLGVSDQIKEGTLRGGGADANAADFKLALTPCGAPNQYQNTDSNDFMYAVQSGGGYCVSLAPNAASRPFLCKKSCRANDPRDWTYYDYGECKTDHRLVMRLPQKAPDGVLKPGAEADKYKNDPLVYRLMPPATAAEAITACKAVRATPAPWFVSREKEFTALTGNYSNDRLWTGQTWVRKYGSYGKNAFNGSTSVNVGDANHWETKDSGWGVPPDYWCGFQNGQDGFGVGASAWPASTYSCDVSGVPRTCVHPYTKDWQTPAQLGKGPSQWWLWEGSPKPASGTQAFTATQSLWKWGTTPSVGTLELAACIKATGTNGQGQTETRDDCWQDAWLRGHQPEAQGARRDRVHHRQGAREPRHPTGRAAVGSAPRGRGRVAEAAVAPHAHRAHGGALGGAVVRERRHVRLRAQG